VFVTALMSLIYGNEAHRFGSILYVGFSFGDLNWTLGAMSFVYAR
jgi:hypothetical protein